MSLDITLTAQRPTKVFEANYTHNMTPMAAAAGIYELVWHPDRVGVKTAGQVIEPLRVGIELLRSDPERFMTLNPGNGWGDYAGFIRWLEKYLQACTDHPDAEVSTCT